MLASESITCLNYLVDIHGDLPVFVNHESNDVATVLTLSNIGFVISKDHNHW